MTAADSFASVPGGHGDAGPARPGPLLGQHGVNNIGQFVSQFNDRTKEMKGITIPVVITVSTPTAASTS